MMLPFVLAGAALAGGYHYAGMWPGSRFFGRAILAGSDAAEIALTYDDGPNAVCTSELLDTLAAHGVRATFFLIGDRARRQPQAARAIHVAGHLVGSHTLTHPRLMYLCSRRMREEVAGGVAAVEDAVGAQVRYFRPPFGGRRPELFHILRELEQTPVMWNVSSHDWDARSISEVEQRVKRGLTKNRRLGRGSNVLMHDGSHLVLEADRRRTVIATASLLPEARAAGMRFVTVDAWAP